MTQSKASRLKRWKPFSWLSLSGFSSLAQAIGTRVSDTTAEIRIVTDSVMANSRNKRPTTSPMNNSGISTAISDTVSEMMVKPICSEPCSAACNGVSPSSM
jgi:hypothetical protein